MSLHCYLDLENSNPISSAWRSSLPYQVWLQKVQQFTCYYSDHHWLEFWTFVVTMTFNTVILSFHKALWLMIIKHKAKLGCKRIIHSKGRAIWVIFWLYQQSPTNQMNKHQKKTDTIKPHCIGVLGECQTSIWPTTSECYFKACIHQILKDDFTGTLVTVSHSAEHRHFVVVLVTLAMTRCTMCTP